MEVFLLQLGAKLLSRLPWDFADAVDVNENGVVFSYSRLPGGLKVTEGQDNKRASVWVGDAALEGTLISVTASECHSAQW